MLESIGNDEEKKKEIVNKLIELDQLNTIRKEPDIPYQLECY
jgi:hypothetical protein